jgi:hypothetical protein
MRIALMLPITLLLALSSTPVAGADDIVDVSDLSGAVERTMAAETAYLGALVLLEAPAVGIDAMVVVDVTGQVAFGEELQGWLEGEMLEIGSFAIIVDGNDWYLSGEVVDGLVELGSWLQVDVSAAPPGFGELQGSFEVGSDAALALYWLLGADGPIEVLGTESLGGTQVTHVEVPIDLELVRDQLPRWLLPAYGSNLAGLREAGADVDRAEAWLGDDGFIRRLTYDMPISLGDELGLLKVAYDLSGFGQPIESRSPDPATVVDAWELVAGE